MTKKDRHCDGKNCNHEFEEGEEYIFRPEEPDEIYCSRGCAESWYADPYGYRHIGDEKEYGDDEE